MENVVLFGKDFNNNTEYAGRSSSTTTRVRAREDEEMLFEYYCGAFGLERIPPYIAQMFRRLMGLGMQAPVIMGAIDATQLAPRPSPAYMAAILNRYVAQGIFTMELQFEDQERHDARYRRSAKQREDDMRGSHMTEYGEVSNITGCFVD